MKTASLHPWLIALCLLFTHFATAADTAFIRTALEKPILDVDKAWQEVADYTEARVPLMPKVRTAAQWEKEAARLRQEVFDRVIFRDATSQAWRDAKVGVEWQETIEGGPGYKIRKARYEALPGLWIPALLYEPEKLTGKVPVMLAVNGHDGVGKAADYKQIRCINLAKRGMLVLNLEWIGMGQLRTDGFMHYRMNQLDLCGVSGIAVHFLAQKRGLDLLLSHPNADTARVAVSGLSGGGWQTIFFSSLDTRVTLCNPVAGYSSFRTRARHISDLGDSEQTPNDLATVVDYTHLTAMLAPRAALLTHNATDQCCFAAPHALPPLLEAAAPIYRLFNADLKLRHHVNFIPGTHNFLQENREALYRAIGDYFYAHDPNFTWQEINVTNEVKTAAQLNVALPEGNLDFQKIAQSALKELPRFAAIPSDAGKLKSWQKNKREQLAAIVRAHPGKVTATKLGTETKGQATATWWALRIDDAWTVPAVELVNGTPTETVILVADNGRKSTLTQAEALLTANKRVLAIDPFYFGESKISKRDFLYALLVAAVGDRPLGLQASQVAGIARWAHTQNANQPVTIHAVGPRSSMFTLVAAGLEDKAITGIELTSPLKSLHDVINNNWSVDKYPELFCFGLLEAFDLPQLEALVKPRAVVKR
jgi:dienelactone hydrolase